MALKAVYDTARDFKESFVVMMSGCIHLNRDYRVMGIGLNTIVRLRLLLVYCNNLVWDETIPPHNLADIVYINVCVFPGVEFIFNWRN